MSHLQAFHTSCRSGLSGHPGFQFNAASAGLAPEQLSRLAASHSGYRLPPDAPPEPEPAEIAALPVSLRYLPVDGVGAVVSRTAYVGREFRGRDGEADSGRFGNYFSHIVVGDEGGFGDLCPVELWGAAHWTTREADGPELPPLAGLEPGPLDLEAVLQGLLPRRRQALGPVAEAALRAALGGPRLVVVEPEPELAPLWVAWATFALPPDRVAALTFSTFEGRPRNAEALRLCVTTPACDVDFASYELDSSVTVIAAAAAPPRAGLYGRVAAALAARGAEAVTAATRSLAAGLELDTAAATLAVAGDCPELVEPAELPATLAVLRARAERGAMAPIAATAAALPAAPDSAAEASEWSQLQALARWREGDDGAVELADESLRRLLDFLAGGGEAALAPVPPDAPVAPSVSVLARWMELVSAAAGGPRLAPLALAGSRLALVGCNAALDRELAALLAAGFADPAVEAACGEIAAAGGSRVVEALALRLGALAASGGSLEALRRIAADPVARAALRRAAEEGEGFESRAPWELLRAGADPAAREAATAALADLATTEAQATTIRRLYGPDGPSDPDAHAMLLHGWLAAGRTAPARDQEAALRALAELRFDRKDAARRLWEALREGPAAVRGDVETRAWGLRLDRPPRRRPFAEWARELAALLRSPELPPRAPRREELEGLAAAVAVECLDEDGYGAGIEALIEATDVQWPQELGAALARMLERSLEPERLLARFYRGWHQVRPCRKPLLEFALPAATRDRPAKELEAVGPLFGGAGQRAWEDWLERHPPRRAVSRAVRGVLRRGEGER